MQNYYISGQWNFICDRCGRKQKSGLAARTWEGWMVCKATCWERKHPQLMIRGVPDDVSPPWKRPEAPDVFVHNIDSIPNYCNLPCPPDPTTHG